MMRFLGRRRERRLLERDGFRQVRRLVADDVSELAQRLANLHSAPDAAEDHQRAVELFQGARRSLAAADDVPALRETSATLEEARFHLVRVLARRDGAPLPERRRPCAFDPRHGPSVRDVVWTPPHGPARSVPVCAADARRIEQDSEPEHRLVRVGDRMVPWYVATPLSPGGAYDTAAAVDGRRGHVAPGVDTRLTDKHVAEAHLRSFQNPDAHGGAHSAG